MAKYWGEVEIIQNWQNIEENYSNVTVNYYACSDTGAGWSNYATHLFCGIYYGSEKIEESKTLASFDFRKSKKILLGSITRNIPHSADGTMSISSSLTWNSDHSLIGTVTGSKYQVLTTIPRASNITATDANIGSASTININGASPDFTHTVTYSFTGLTGTIATKTNQRSIGWNVPISFFQKIPNSQNGTVTITCQTYSGDTLIGTKTTSMIVSVPTTGNYNSMPVIDSVKAVDVNAKTIALTQDSSRLVTYFSNVKINAVARCLNYGAFSVLKSNNISMSNAITTSNGITTVKGEITHNSNSKPSFNVFIGDARGLWVQRVLSEANGDFTIVPYIPLTMSVNASRISPTSNSIKLNFAGNFYNGYFDKAKNKFNALKIKWRYKLKESGTWIKTGANDTENGWHNLTLNKDYKYSSSNTYYSGNGASAADIEIKDLFNYQKVYTIEISYEDSLSSYSIQKDISAGIPCCDRGVDASGNNYFNVNGEYYKNGLRLLDLVYPIGSIYMSVKNINPSTYLGGTWVTWGAGKVPVGVDTTQTEFATVEKTGGEKTHTLTEAQIPKHLHKGLFYDANNKNITLNSGTSTNYNLSWGNSGSAYNEINTGYTGGDQPHNNLQPYITCYMWKRTA